MNLEDNTSCLSVVVHLCNPWLLWRQRQEDHSLRPAQAKVNKTQSQKQFGHGIATPVVPAIQEAEEGGSLSEAGPGKCTRPSLEGKKTTKKEKRSGHWWLMPVILATQETEIRRIQV
jgi:hypothetical protein